MYTLVEPIAPLIFDKVFSGYQPR